MHSTITAIHVIYDHIQRGLNEKRPNKRKVMVALDLSRAFETTVLPTIKKMPWKVSVKETDICDNINFKYRGIKSRVPQGRVLSATLFNLPLLPEVIELITYVADCTLLSSNINIYEISCK